MKTCAKCGGERLNVSGRCKDCLATYMRSWSARHPEKVREQRRKKKESGKKRESDRRYHKKHKVALIAKQNIRYQKNRDYYLAYKQSWYEANKERMLKLCKEAAAKRYATDPEGERKKRAEYAANKRKTDPQYLVYGRMSCLLRQHLKRTYRDASSKAGRQWPQLVGYTVDALMAHLKQTIPKGYTWDDYLTGVLEVDHIQPDCTFEYRTVDDPGFKQSWALTNLRLLTAQENSSRRYV